MRECSVGISTLSGKRQKANRVSVFNLALTLTSCHLVSPSFFETTSASTSLGDASHRGLHFSELRDVKMFFLRCSR